MSSYSSNPWGMIGQIIGSALNSNAEGMKKSKEQTNATQQSNSNQPQGMVMQTAPALDRSASDATTPGSMFYKMDPINSQMSGATMKGIQLEKDLYAPVGPTTGGFILGPAKVDSSAPAYDSKIKNYLNYMRYRT